MTNSPDRDREPESNPTSQRIWLLWLSRSGLAFGVILIFALVGGALWAWVFVREQLAPLVEKNLAQTLKRPVRLGRVERFSLTGLRFGASEVPATPTDPDRATVEAVDVAFDPITLLFDRTLQLNVTLVNPDVYIQQDRTGRWIVTEVKGEENVGAFKTELESVRLQNADVILVPEPPTGEPRVPVGIAELNGDVRFLDSNQRLRFNLLGKLATGGNFNLDGEYLPKAQQTNVSVQGQDLLASDIDRLLKLPLDLQVGRVDANLQVKYNPKQPIFLLGMANLENITAGLKQLPTPFFNTNGILRFQEQVIRLDDVSSQFGLIPIQANGGLNLQKGFGITAKVPNIEINKVAQTLKLKTPVPIKGEVGAELRLLGTIQEPILAGQFVTAKQTQVDKVNFNAISGRFALITAQSALLVRDLQAKPVVGGQITGGGQVKLGEKGGAAFDLRVQNVPGDAIAPLYGLTLSPTIKLGRVNARTQVFGPFGDFRTVARWQAPEATYPGTGEVIVARNQTILRDANFKVAGGTVQVAARVADGKWLAEVAGNGLPVNRLIAEVQRGEAQKAEIPLALQQGIFSGKARLAGTLQSFKLPDIQAVAQGRIQRVAGGTVQILQAGVAKGQWEALLEGNGLLLTSLLSPEQARNFPLQQARFNGKVKLGGNVESFKLPDIKAIAQGRIQQVAGGSVQIQQAQLDRGVLQAILDANAVQLSRLTQLPNQLQAVFTGKAKVVGNVESFQLENLQAAAQGRLQIAGGTVQIQQAQLSQGRWEALFDASGVQLSRLPNVPNQLQAAFSGRVKAAGGLDAQLSGIDAIAQGSLRVANGTIQIRQAQLEKGAWQAIVAASNVPLSRIPNLPRQLQGAFSGQLQIAGNLTALQDNKSPLSSIRAAGNGEVQVAGGNIQIQNLQVADGRWQTLLDASRVQLNRLAQLPNGLPAVFTGKVGAQGSIDSFKLADIQGAVQGSLQVAGGTVQIENLQLAEGRWQGVFDTKNLPLNRLAQLPNQLQAVFTGKVGAQGSIDSFKLADIQGAAQGNLQVAGGTVRVQQAQLAEGRWQALLDANSVQLNRLAPLPNQLQAVFTGQARLAGSATSFQLANIQGAAQGNLQVAGGTIKIQQAQIAEGRWQASLDANAVQLSRFPQVPAQLRGLLNGQFQVAGNLDAIQNSRSPLSQIQAIGRGSIQLADSTVEIRQLQLDKGRFQTSVSLAQVQLNRFSEQLRGRISGDVTLAGTLPAGQFTSLPLSAIQAAGQINLSEGIAAINGPLVAAFQWNGQQLLLQRATAPGLNASGTISASFTRAGTPQITAINLNVEVQDLNLQQLPINLPNNVALAGRADFAGRVTGTPTAPNIDGNLRLENLIVNGFDFESVLTGRVQSPAGGGVSLDVAGSRDRIAVQLSPNNQPESFFIQRNETIAQGRRQGDLLLANVRNLPIATIGQLLPLPREIASQPISGIISGDFALNLNDNSIAGSNVAIANAEIGNFRGYQITGGSFRFANGVAELTGLELQQGDSRYAFNGSLIQTSRGPQINARLQVTRGRIQEVLKAFRSFNLPNLIPGSQPQNYGSAADVPTVTVGVPNQSLQTQLRRFSEIEALIGRQVVRQCAASPLPELKDLQGDFGGEIYVAGSIQSGLALNFNVQGDNWKWGRSPQNAGIPGCDRAPLELDRVIARGSFENGILTVSPLRLELDRGAIAFAGQITPDRVAGQFQAIEFPIEIVKSFVAFPADITGKLNATARLVGNLTNPTITDGKIALIDGTINKTPVQTAQADFSYVNARLNFGSTVLIQGTKPVAISGSIPYQLPFTSVAPDSNQIALTVDVADEGLALLNIFTDQVQWVNGKGQVQLRVRGTLTQPIADGTAIFENATLTARALPAPLTNVNAGIEFNRDRISIQQFQGQFSQGQVTASGVLPLSNPSATIENPLNVALDNLRINLKGLYQGGVNGRVVVTGTALNPEIGGRVQLANGQVLLAEASPTTAPAATTNGDGGNSNNPVAVPEFNNLQLTLGNGVRVARPPLLSFEATGDLLVNGLLNDLRPRGIITLRKGSVNLFTTQFNLARGYEQTAQFTPSQGLDPELNVRLVATVPEVTRSRLPANQGTIEFGGAEISDIPATGLGALQTVRIQAIVNGPASQLANNLELRSDPPRSEAEIVSLIGGGFVENLGRGDSTLGLANLAGAALLSSPIQGTISRIGEAIGLTELRLFPTVSSEGSRGSRLGLAAEAVIDLPGNVSASVSKVLTTDQPIQYNLRYRLNDNILLRGSTDLSGENRAVIEYESRF